ncbi:uncharacterized protein J4E92_009747 [Alternaria infectoria]|uniref:uncharacterized protein n=1 Tax=Alternaria infectoria TaxID=45303 RepID=UPI00222097AC|nr:uncharacterized protein J4E92_009747 [Alternaria infectoria]KAI4913398.1 hypothetical protein J4E92_009747 [Alternaria infectoria]
MPLWIIYHPPNTFTSLPDKTALANEITKLYTIVGLPRFYVNVLFQPIQPESFFIGGVPRPSPNSEANKPGRDSSVPMIRIKMEHLARQFTSIEHKHRFMDAVDKALKPFIADKGYDWEYSCEDVDRDLWKVNGMVPPMPGTEAEKEWAEKNVAVPFGAEKGGLEGKL